MPGALAAIDPGIRTKPYGWTALPPLPGRARPCMLPSSDRAPIDPISMIGDTVRQAILHARTATDLHADLPVCHVPRRFSRPPEARAR